LGLDPVALSKIGTGLLASLGRKGKNRSSLACLRNAGSYSAETYCNILTSHTMLDCNPDDLRDDEEEDRVAL
jgi:hypothetical protein